MIFLYGELPVVLLAQTEEKGRERKGRGKGRGTGDLSSWKYGVLFCMPFVVACFAFPAVSY